MPQGSYDITCDQGASFVLSITWQSAGTTPALIDLTGYQAHLQVRPSAGSPTTILDCSTTGYNGGTGDGYITLGTTNGVISINVPAEVMVAVPPGGYKYDLDMISGTGPTAYVVKLLGGKFKVNAAVSVDQL